MAKQTKMRVIKKLMSISGRLLCLLLVLAACSPKARAAEEDAAAQNGCFLLLSAESDGTGLRADICFAGDALTENPPESVAVFAIAEEQAVKKASVFKATGEDGRYSASIRWEGLRGPGQYRCWATARYEDGETARTSDYGFRLKMSAFCNAAVTRTSEKEHYVRLRLFDARPAAGNPDLTAAVWQKEDMSDLTWGTASWRKDGSYRLQADSKKFDLSSGEYNAGTLALEAAPRPSGGVYETEGSVKQPAIEVSRDTAIRLSFPAEGENTWFAVWGEENGQNDLAWYPAVIEDGTARAEIPVSEHPEPGNGRVDAWILREDGSMELAGQALYRLDLSPEVTAAVTQEPSQAPELSVAVSGGQAPGRILAAVYSSEDMSDLHWYAASQGPEGDFRIRFDSSYHRLHTGDFQALIYVENEAGIAQEAAACPFTVSGEEAGIRVVQRGTSPLVELHTENIPGAGQSLKELSYLVGKQSESGDVQWTAVEAAMPEGDAGTAVLLRWIGGPGSYTVRAVGTWKNGLQQDICETTVSFRDPPFPKAAEVLDAIGWDLFAAFRWSASLTYYGHNDIMPDTELPGVRWYADYGFDNLKGNCYVMASTFYEMALDLGYKGRQITGGVGMRAGGIGPHSWVELDLEDGTYVFDPNFTNESGGNGFKIHYGDSGTWSYQMGHAMKMYDQR